MLKMFGKLLKYDIRAGAKAYSLMFIILAVLAAVTGLACLIDITIINGFVFTTAIIGSVACAVVVIVATIKQLYAQMCGKESYLTYTLPVGTAAVVLSKIINIIIWVVLAVAGVCLYWFLYHKICSADIKMTLDSLITKLSNSGVGSLLFTVMGMSVITSAFLVMLSAGIANIPSLKNRNAGVPIAVAAWYLISQTLGLIFAGIWFIYIIANNGEISNEYLNNPENTARFLDVLKNIMVVGYSISSLVFFFLAVKVIGKRRSI